MLTFADWLALREAADASARSTELADEVRERLRGRSTVTVHDLGTGTGAMGRWLAPRLDAPQHWILYDRDDDLLALAQARVAPEAKVTTRNTDITRLTAADLGDADLITASALLDMFTGAEVARVVDACAGVRCPVLFTLSVIGDVRLTPADPLDAEIMAAFNAHQRRTAHGRSLVGPDAAKLTIDAFTYRGARVVERSTPWTLGADQADLIAEWFKGWLGAACEQRPELAGPVEAYAARRLAENAAGDLRVTVGHVDLLVVWD
ncbi:hypothetical protein Val02_91790 [Virgisporangium aliadipatigenens]|uniref:Methyltransferase domain-containing protein n=1 Tax=Virgisporangium aliadipatigenens TaxID=741659 RepID=A0A8J3YX84_9ACTN|nr:class I SAM-dependent methyltransferase [Virgisporangium aliadipatigenens]GIJ52293.1 hypothetical protein Val02_91790 [Virgisporangium aliadipatigenens]